MELSPFVSSVESSITTFTDFVSVIRNLPDADKAKWSTIESEYMEHLKWRFRSARVLHRNQLVLTWMITVAVMALVAAGIAFSFMQLRVLLASPGDRAPTTELAASLSELNVSSSILGVVVLGLSLAFFFLFLKYVFLKLTRAPIHLGLSETDYFTFREYEQAERALKRKGKSLRDVLKEGLETTTSKGGV